MPFNWLLERIESFIARQLAPIKAQLARIEGKINNMGTTIEQLNAEIAILVGTDDTLVSTVQALKTAADANTASAKKVDADITTLLAKVAAGASSVDVTAQLNAIQAEVAKNIASSTTVGTVAQTLTTATGNLDAADASVNPAPASAIVATPTSVVLSVLNPSQVLTVNEAAFAGATFTAESSSPNDVTVAPASAPGSFTVTATNPGTPVTATITVKDNATNPNTVVVNVSVS